MIVDSIIDFSGYLNNNGFDVTHQDITRMFSMLPESGVNIEYDDNLIMAMRTSFCHNSLQYANLPKLFSNFIKRQKDISNVKKMQEELEQIKNDYETAKNSKPNTHKKSDDKIDYNLSEKDKQFLKDNKKTLNKTTHKLASFLSKNELIPNAFSAYNQELKDVVKYSESALKKGNLDEFNIWNKYNSILKKVSKPINEYNKTESDRLKEKREELERIKKRIKDKQSAIDKQIADINKEVDIEKPQSVSNRDEFIGGKNSVRLTNDMRIPQKVDLNFSSLQEEDKQEIYDYIKNNLLAFKTKMTRNIKTDNKHQIDMLATIQSACKTGGFPIDLIYQKPKRSKAKLVLILDVSGSCKQASEMMLMFMWILQDIFPRGCKTFAFVDSLYDISKVMQAHDVKQAINACLDLIPRRGVYSNYYIPINQLWEDYRKEITSDSTLIFIGDARNNKNDSAADCLKNIVRHAKRAYWLNTDDHNEWDNGDSIAGIYAKYMPMLEIITPRDLLKFIWRIK